jgi:hypothetical protein
MSNLFKSKFFFGVMIVTVMLVGVGMSTTSHAAAATCSITSTLKLGSKGTQVACLQSTFLSLTADGNFGPKTKTAVMAWQTKEGLTADGVFGAKSLTVWEGSTVTASLPVGCSSTTGFSATTGLPCNSATVSTYPAGCTSAAGFSPTTGASCSTGVMTATYPAGCTSAVGYSSTTGASCATGVTTTTVVNPTGAGNISSDSILGGFANTIVGGGDVNHQVAGFQLTGAGGGSNLNLSSATIQLVETNLGTSSRMADYFSSVALFENGVQVGTLPYSAFQSNNVSGISNYVYSASMPLTGATVTAGQQSNFYVAVSAVPSIDSQNYGGIWDLQVNNIRFTDGTGTTLTYSPTSFPAFTTSLTAATFSFNSASTANNIVLNVARASSDQNAHTVTVNTTGGSTSKVPLLQVALTTQGGQVVSVNKLPVTFTSAGASTSNASSSTGTSGGTVNVGGLANEVYLMNGTTVLDSESIPSGLTGATATAYPVVFKISSGSPLLVSSPVTLTVAADINSTTGGAYVGGASLTASTLIGQTSNLSNGWDLTVGNTNGSELLTYGSGGNANTVVPGTAVGQQVAFYATGVSVAETGDTCTANNNSDVSSTSSLSCVVTYNVTANGAPAYIPQAGGIVSAGTISSPMAVTNAISFVVQNSASTSPVSSHASVSISQVGVNATSSDGGLEWTIPAGTTAQFSANVVVTDPNNASGGEQLRGYLANVVWGTNTGTWGTNYNFNLNNTNTVVPGYTYIY